MQTKQLLLFAAIAVLGGAIFSMVTFGVFAAQTNSNNYNANAASDASLIDSILADNGMTDDEEEDEDECNEDDEAMSNEASGVSGEDADEAGDTDVNDEEDEGEEEDEAEDDESVEAEEESGAPTAIAGGNSTMQADDEEEEEDENMAFEPCVFSSEINNPYLPLSKYVNKTLTFAGNSTEGGQSVNVEEVWTVLSNTTEIADVETLTVMVQEYEGDVLVQEALQYYAQGIDGVVYFFGEDVVDYENGVAVENDDESWEVGDDAAVPGIAMPATPAPGMGFAYHSVNVPGIAHELSEVKSLNETISVEFGSFTAIEVTDYDFNDGTTSQEFYASGVGLIKETEDEEQLELISIS
ncbi:MAG TPA: hypothetical protein VIE86_07190 [Nitrososphaera sp.]|jgi:hypothetical protein